MVRRRCVLAWKYKSILYAYRSAARRWERKGGQSSRERRCPGCDSPKRRDAAQHRVADAMRHGSITLYFIPIARRRDAES